MVIVFEAIVTDEGPSNGGPPDELLEEPDITFGLLPLSRSTFSLSRSRSRSPLLLLSRSLDISPPVEFLLSGRPSLSESRFIFSRLCEAPENGEVEEEVSGAELLLLLAPELFEEEDDEVELSDGASNVG